MRRRGRPGYSRRHYDLVSPPQDAAEQIAWRLRDNAIRAQVLVEREARWPVLTAENFAEAVAWQEARICELHKQ